MYLNTYVVISIAVFVVLLVKYFNIRPESRTLLGADSFYSQIQIFASFKIHFS